MKSLSALTALLLLLTSIPAHSQDRVSLSTYYIPGLAESATKGSLINAVQEIENHLSYEIDINFAPIKRVQASFLHNRIVGYFPELDEHAPLNVCKSLPLGYKGIYAFWRTGETPPIDIADLEGKKVGIVQGYSYGEKILKNPAIKIEAAKNDDVNVRKLLAKRIDYIIGDERSTVAAIKKNDAVRAVSFDLSKQIHSLPFFFVFQTSPEGKKICNDINRAMSVIRKSGGFKSFR